MRKYYDNKKYYINKALKIAQKNNNVKAFNVLKILNRHNNVCDVKFVERINNIKIYDVDLFNIERNKD